MPRTEFIGIPYFSLSALFFPSTRHKKKHSNHSSLEGCGERGKMSRAVTHTLDNEGGRRWDCCMHRSKKGIALEENTSPNGSFFRFMMDDVARAHISLEGQRRIRSGTCSMLQGSHDI